jgi:ElaB/YqjD/DUF883 family membrane-anchored ribosome-binding protein
MRAAAREDRERDEACGRDAAQDAARQADARFEESLTRLAREIATLRRDFHAIIDQIGRVGDAAGDTARSAVQAASMEGWGASERATAELGAELGGLKEDLVRTAREHPWRTLGLAAAAGAVLGLLMRR